MLYTVKSQNPTAKYKCTQKIIPKGDKNPLISNRKYNHNKKKPYHDPINKCPTIVWEEKREDQLICNIHGSSCHKRYKFYVLFTHAQTCKRIFGCPTSSENPILPLAFRGTQTPNKNTTNHIHRQDLHFHKHHTTNTVAKWKHYFSFPGARVTSQTITARNTQKASTYPPHPLTHQLVTGRGTNWWVELRYKLGSYL